MFDAFRNFLRQAGTNAQALGPQAHFNREYGRKAPSAPFNPLSQIPGVGIPDPQSVPMAAENREFGGKAFSPLQQLQAAQASPVVGGLPQAAPLPPPRPAEQQAQFNPFAPAFRTGDGEDSFVTPGAYGATGAGEPGDGIKPFVQSGAVEAFHAPKKGGSLIAENSPVANMLRFFNRGFT